MHLNIFPKLWLLSSAKKVKIEPFLPFNDYNSGIWSLHKWPHIFHPLFELYQFVYYSFASKGIQKSIPWSSSFTLSHGVWNTHLLSKDDTFKLVTLISFFNRKVANFQYITCFVPNLISIWSRSHGLKNFLELLKYKKLREKHKLVNKYRATKRPHLLLQMRKV